MADAEWRLQTELDEDSAMQHFYCGGAGGIAPCRVGGSGKWKAGSGGMAMGKGCRRRGAVCAKLIGIAIFAIAAALAAWLVPGYLNHARRAKISADIACAETIVNAFNKALEDGVIPFPAVGGTAAYDLPPEGLCFSEWPTSRLEPSRSDWVVTTNEFGVFRITLNGKEIWPDPDVVGGYRRGQ